MNVQLLVAGVSMGIIYGLIAIGMVLIFRSVGVMNFAQGEFLMFGGYFCYTFNKILNLPIVLSLVLASLSMGVVGILFMRTSYWPLRSAQAKAIIVSAMGASIVFKEGARLIWGVHSCDNGPGDSGNRPSGPGNDTVAECGNHCHLCNHNGSGIYASGKDICG